MIKSHKMWLEDQNNMHFPFSGLSSSIYFLRVFSLQLTSDYSCSYHGNNRSQSTPHMCTCADLSGNKQQQLKRKGLSKFLYFLFFVFFFVSFSLFCSSVDVSFEASHCQELATARKKKNLSYLKKKKKKIQANFCTQVQRSPAVKSTLVRCGDTIEVCFTGLYYCLLQTSLLLSQHNKVSRKMS